MATIFRKATQHFLKTGLLVFLLLSSRFTTFAQEYQNFPVEPGYSFFEVLKNGKEDKMFVIYSSEAENKILVNCYDGSLTLLWQVRNPIVLENEPVLFEKFFVFKSLLYLATVVENKETSKGELYIQSFDDGGKLSEKRKKLGEMGLEKDTKEQENVHNHIDFNFITSDDESKLLVSYADITSPDENVFLNCIVYNENFNNVSIKKVEFPYIDKNMLIDKVELGNKGDVFILSRYLNAAATPTPGVLNSEYGAYLYHYDSGRDVLTKSQIAKSIKTYSADIETQGVYNFELDNNTNTVSVFAWAWNQEASESYNGMYYMLYNADTKVLETEKLIPFTKDLKVKIIGEKQTALGSGFSFSCDKAYTFGNGNICVIGHTFNKLVKTRGSKKGSNFRVFSLKQYLLYLVISRDGKIIKGDAFEHDAMNESQYYSFMEKSLDDVTIVYRNINKDHPMRKDSVVASNEIKPENYISIISVKSDGTSSEKLVPTTLKLQQEYQGEAFVFNNHNLVFLDQAFVKIVF